MLGQLTTGDGIPIGQHAFAGDTRDVTRQPEVLADLQARFGVGRICVVGDAGLKSEDNVEEVGVQGFSHILPPALHNKHLCAGGLDAAHRPDAERIPVPQAQAAACDVTLDDGRRCVVVASQERWRRDTTRTDQRIARTEAKLLALEDRVRAGELTDPDEIGRAA